MRFSLLALMAFSASAALAAPHAAKNLVGRDGPVVPTFIAGVPGAGTTVAAVDGGKKSVRRHTVTITKTSGATRCAGHYHHQSSSASRAEHVVVPSSSSAVTSISTSTSTSTTSLVPITATVATTPVLISTTPVTPASTATTTVLVSTTTTPVTPSTTATTPVTPSTTATTPVTPETAATTTNTNPWNTATMDYLRPTADSTAPAAIMEVVNDYRKRANLADMEWNPTLATNALNTSIASAGSSLVHHLYPGSNAQVMVYGSHNSTACGIPTEGLSSFGVSFYSWLCEVPTSAALGVDFCKMIAATGRINNAGQTGHHDILSGDYKTIGCGWAPDPSLGCSLFGGTWTCDLA